MKRLFVFLLIACIAGQAFVRTAWVLDYQWNRAVYLKNCENRSKKDFHCDGKCYLKKKMAASENNNPAAPQLPEGFHQIKDIQLYFDCACFFPRFSCDADRRELLPSYMRRFLPDAPIAGVFKPPAA